MGTISLAQIETLHKECVTSAGRLLQIVQLMERAAIDEIEVEKSPSYERGLKGLKAFRGSAWDAFEKLVDAGVSLEAFGGHNETPPSTSNNDLERHQNGT